MATIKDVAERAGVSVSTVSHVMNNTRFVSEALASRVKTAIEELSYRQNALAQGLRKGHNRIIGLIVPDIANPYFSEMARTIEDKGFQQGYSVILCNSDNDTVKERSYVETLVDRRVSGIIYIFAGPDSTDIVRSVSNSVPVVSVDGAEHDPEVDSILVDNRQGGYLATRHLVELGHHDIACIAGPDGTLASRDRIRGYQQAMHEAGFETDPTKLVHGDFGFSSGRTGMMRLLQAPTPPSAVFACNDLMALGAIQAVLASGRKVPTDVSIAGFDDTLLAAMSFPTLTTVRQPVDAVARAAVARIIGHIEQVEHDGERRLPTPLTLEPELVVRDSTGPANARTKPLLVAARRDRSDP